MSTRPAADAGPAMMPVTVSVHLYPSTPVRVRLHPQDDRVVLIVGEATGVPTLNVFAHRAELVALCDVLAAAVVDLDTARQTPTPHDTDDASDDEATVPAA